MNFEREWLAHFPKDISKSLLRKRVIGGGNYICHIFSWELVGKDMYLEGDTAKKMYDGIDKSEAKYFSLWEDENSR